MTGSLSVVLSRINKELKTLESLQNELAAMLERGPAEQDFERIRAYSSLLHDFYTCIEKVFQTVAKGVDDYVPEGENWHKNLLEQMALPLDDRRPPVISEELADILTEYLAFRHRVRNIYGFQLQWEKMAHLIRELPGTVQKVKAELAVFMKKIEEMEV